jgi:CHAT domain-containing protein
MLTKAHDATNRVPPSALREQLVAELAIADASVKTPDDPRAFDDAITTLRAHHFGHLLSQAYLQRARAARACRQFDAALADYAAGLDAIEAQQRNLTDADQRLAFLDVGAQLIEDAVDLHLDRGDVSKAFAVAERAHGGSASLVPASVRENVIEYVLLPRAIAIFVIADGKLCAVRVPMTRRAAGARVEDFAEKIQRRVAAAEIASEGRQLFDLLLAPAITHLRDAKSVVIVPDRELYALPFSALYDGAKRKYLVEELALSIAPSASSVSSGAGDGLKPAIVVGDPRAAREARLDASRQEAERIASLYGAPPLIGADATIARFTSAAANAAMIHYSGHAESQALLLAGGSLDAVDIERLPLNMRPLVVLAGCGTFRGDRSHIGGMPSIARSFLVAGARAVAGTLWAIDDDTSAPLFFAFHQRLREGASPEQAVRAAQLSMLRSRDARLGHPASWAAVELITSSSRRNS